MWRVWPKRLKVKFRAKKASVEVVEAKKASVEVVEAKKALGTGQPAGDRVPFTVLGGNTFKVIRFNIEQRSKRPLLILSKGQKAFTMVCKPLKRATH